MGDLRVIEAEPIGEDVITTLREVLAKAETGELSSVAITVVYRNGCTGSAWSARPSAGLQLGSVALLQWRLAEKTASV
jgi:hypothetical protein